MGLCPDTLKLPQIAFRAFLFTLCCASHRACQKIVQPALIFTAYLILWLSPTFAFLFVPNGLNETLRHWECGSSREARRAAEERGKERTLMHGEDGTESIILRSAYVCVCVTALERESNSVCVCVRVCVFIYVCMCWRKRGRHQGRSERWREWACRLGNVTLGRFVGFDPGKLMQNPSASIWFGKTLGADLSLNNNYWVYINFLPYSLPQESWSPLLVSWG